FGQRKSIRSDRVILIPGPSKEIETVNLVYDLFVRQKAGLNAIARTLNAQGLSNANGNPWNSIAIRELLSNEKYVGSAVYNRTSKKLGANWKRNSPAEWIRTRGAFKAIVAPEVFVAAQKRLADNVQRFTRYELLDLLTALWCREKTLSRDIIESSKSTPSTNT